MQEVANSGDKFEVVEVLKGGGEIVKNNIKFIAIMGIVWMGIPAIFGAFAGSGMADAQLSQDPAKISSAAFFQGLVIIIDLVWAVLLAPGIYKIILKLLNNESAELTELIPTDIPLLLKVAGASFLLGTAIGIGCIFLIVPGVFLAIKLQYTLFLIVDQNYGIIEAMKKSWEMTNGHVVKILLLFLSFLGIAIVFSIAIAIVSIPFAIVGKLLNILPLLTWPVQGLLQGVSTTFFFLAIGITYKKLSA